MTINLIHADLAEAVAALSQVAERLEDRYQGAVSLAAELRSLAAILDVRRGDLEPPLLVRAKKARSSRSSRRLLRPWWS